MSIIEKKIGINEDTLIELEKKGIVRVNSIRDFNMYKRYIEHINSMGKMQAITNISLEFNLSEDSVQKIIYRINKIG